MTDEISKFGTGERGTFKLDKPKADTTRVNKDVLCKESERGTWAYNREKKRVERCKKQRKPLVHAIHQDTIPETEALVGAPRKFDSRSALERYYREHGHSSISKEELRQEWARWERERAEAQKFNPREHAEHWERAEQELRAGNVELTEWEKELCRRENRKLKEWQEGSRPDSMARAMREGSPMVEVRKD